MGRSGTETTTESAAPRHIVLVGLMGAGKTTTGLALAERLGRQLVDSDLLIEQRTGRTVREIWRTDGEDAFRSLERAALLDALGSPAPAVIAAAGGVVIREENRLALRAADALVVWLQADLDVLTARATTGDHRPLLDADPAAMMQQMAADRDEWYREVADVVVDTTNRSPAAVTDEILGRLDAEAQR